MGENKIIAKFDTYLDFYKNFSLSFPKLTKANHVWAHKSWNLKEY